MGFIRPLSRVVSPRVLVVGGGIAGMQAALEAAGAGLPVTLVEAGPSLGGLMAQLDKTFPTNDCAMCILSPRMLETARHPLIQVLTMTRVEQIAGQAGDFQVLLTRRPRFVRASRCTGCGECVRVCPRSIPDPYNLGLTQTKAIHVPFPQAVPQAAVIESEACRFLQGRKCRACVEVCPAQAIYLEQAPREMVLAAGAVILAPGARPASAREFPGYGHPDVVTSLEFERLLSATGPHGGKLLRPSDRTPPQRLAFIQCVGSRDGREGGAAYCSATCCLSSLKGVLAAQEIDSEEVEATIFYMDMRAQGKMHEGYLTRAREQRLRLVRSRVTGVEPRAEGGVTVRFTDARGRPRKESFDLAVLTVGLRPPERLAEWARGLGVAVNEHGFLATAALSPGVTGREGILVCGTAREPMDISETVTTAAAAAAAAGQLLAISPRSRVPALPVPEPGPEAEGPARVGVFLCHCGTNIAETVDLEKLAAATRRLPGVAHVEDHLFACSADATRRMMETIQSLRLNRVVVAACTPRTHEAVFREVVALAGLNPGYFAFANIREQCSWVHQGDPAAALAKAKKLVAMAVRQAMVLSPIRLQTFPVMARALVLGGGVAGMSAALTLADQGFHTYLVERERYLGGLARKLFFTLEGPDPQVFLQELQTYVYRHPNIEVLASAKLLQVEGHVGQFRSRVRQRLPERARERTLEHGVVLVATGGQEFQPRGRHLWGEDPRVITQLELEARVNAQDQSLAKVRRVVMIQCVGSREPEHRYCSRVCCSEALKNALLLKERYAALEVTILHRDLRAYGFREIYYQRAKEKGVVFLPFEPERPPRVAGTRFRPLTVRVWDELLDQEVDLPADLVVLSAGIEPAAGSDQVARQLGVPLTAAGFFLEAHLKLRPVDTVGEGVFICGLAHHPKSLGETVVQAQAAAMRAAGILFQTELHRGELTAWIDPGKCRRCLVCVEVCPVGAVHLTGERRPEVLSQVCRGCGVCVAECPGDAIQLSRFTEAELMAQIEAALTP